MEIEETRFEPLGACEAQEVPLITQMQSHTKTHKGATSPRHTCSVQTPEFRRSFPVAWPLKLPVS